MKKSDIDLDDDLRPEYDLKALLRDGVQGKYVERIRSNRDVPPAMKPVRPPRDE